jgi:hypothetical protein
MKGAPGLDLWKNFLRHPLHPLQSFSRTRATDIEDHSVYASGAVVAYVRCDLVGASHEPSAPTIDLFLFIEQRTFQGYANGFGITPGASGKFG